jgi:hypothetical protein
MRLASRKLLIPQLNATLAPRKFERSGDRMKIIVLRYEPLEFIL